ncbi:MAG: SirB2 family protein [Thermomonas sp.]|uniref:SirB2 family protein n=1 Tax=Thermomonas sp. TaxID=1971895 RepID=UPI001B52B744|nr:SirB2 family protein [Thermomonas sp.]MBP7158481.1 SirB2 family protein [Thermomonas sp.]MBP7787733.1 SirB2 family protein [Thermomonas sp.]MBP8614654.1 SirB2 family protein [Thermomonas sp.]MBP8647692.1 SirB2 family protein [Thermomonas sp.]MBP9695768.1 SirB2 family protein [Thermomonas sp.]
MIEFYPQIRLFHIFAVLLSGSIFALRGVAALAGARWPQARPLKWLTYAIDTSLLTAALLLVAILPWPVFANGWLLAKIALLFAYVVLGVLALRPQRPRRVRALYFAAALATFALMYGIARAHHPLAWLA